MCSHAQFCIFTFVHLFDGLVKTCSFPDSLVSAVPGVILVDLTSAVYPFGWQADWPGGEFVARVSELDPGDGDILGPTEPSLARFRNLRGT